ncbi:protein PHYTOCHROME KINASE SUBSTRATE 4 [Salvia divinorum]|uniref:Protein PHYTOCHROME KINASE SUBSTRATE 4 n=1 Tax=Salvia divinorum TaxID=28513 RepID=A0ABD1FGX8_SALDI
MDPPSMVKSFNYMSSTKQEPKFHYKSYSSPQHINGTTFQDAYLKEKILGAVEDTEISIFDAQRYFSENTDAKEMIKSVSSTGTRSFHHATPTVSSEASWNSQTGLLANHPGAVRVSLRNFYARRRSRKWKCSCTGKKSVEVKDAGGKANYSSSISQQPKIRALEGFPSPDPPRQQRISAGGYSFPILNHNNATQPPLKPIIRKPISITINPLEEPPRDSLEVFQPVNTDEDVLSDASSDLFEIESFSTQTTSYPMYRRKDSLDEAPTFNARRFASANIQYGRRSVDEPPTPSVAGTECYAPSEVSIDWSVTTAEGFDRVSVSNFSVSASEIGQAAFLRQEESGGKKKGNGGGGLLLMSCRQEKAVSVGPQPVKCVSGAQVSGRLPRAGKPPLATEHSARLSLAFAA